MLFDLIQSGFSRDVIIMLLLSIPIILLSLSVHESAHGIAANALGDNTARNLGRITLNPAKHFDLFGFLAMLIFGFGWAKPVPINTRNMKNAKWGFVFSSLMGPFSNLLLAFIFALLYGFGMVLLSHLAVSFELSASLVKAIAVFFSLGVTLNVTLAIFNMIPIPPLDGSRLLTACLPRKWATWVFRYEHIIRLVLIGLIYLGAFSGYLSVATDGVTDLIFRVVNLIPFGKMGDPQGWYAIHLMLI